MDKFNRSLFGVTFFCALLLAAWSSTLVPSSTKILHDVPLVRQSTHFSCGAAALLSVISYYGEQDYNETDLMKELGTSETHGTYIEKMAEVANKLGIKAEIKSNLSLDDLRARLKKNQPVIVDAQAYHDEKKNTDADPYKDGWTDGHYMVVIGLDKENIYFMDPSQMGSRGYLTLKDFMNRWHEINSKGEKEYRTAILFDGKVKPPAPWEYIP